MAKAKRKNLETRCRMAVDAILNMQNTLRDIEMELTHVIEFGRYKFFSMPKYKGKYKGKYDFYNGNGYVK